MEAFRNVGVTRAAANSSRAIYFSSMAFYNPFKTPPPSTMFTCYNYNKPFNAAYKQGTANGSVGTTAASSAAKRNRV